VTAYHLLIDGRHIDGRANGLSRFSEELTMAMSKLQGVRLTVVSNREITPRRSLPAHVNQLVDRSAWARLPGSLWLSARLPTIARQLRATHVLGTIHLLPGLKPKGLIYGLLMHDLVYIFFPETMTSTNRWLSRFLVPRSLRLADHIFAVSRTTLDDIARQYPGLGASTQVAYPGTTFLAPSQLPVPANGPLRLLFVGSREPRKNLSSLLQAFDIALRRGFSGELHLVSGARWGRDKLSSIIDRYADRGIIIHEKISDSVLIKLYETIDYLVMPSLYEGLGLPVLEAVGRCAVLANDIPVFRELGEHIDGISYLRFQEDSGSLEVLANEFLNLRRCKPAQFRGATIQQQFTWETCARTILQSLLSEERKSRS